MIARLHSLRRRCGPLLIAAVLVFGIGTSPVLADAPLAPRALALRYDVFVGGFYTFGFDVSLGLESDAYEVTVDGGTRGLIGQLFTWRMNMGAQGKLESLVPTPSGFAPARFDNLTEWRGKPRRTTLRFIGHGSYEVDRDPSEIPEERDPEEGELPVSLPAATMDPVAASLVALSASARDGACERRIPVFDGKRRYDLIVRGGDGETSLPPSNFSAYAGPALSCRIGIMRISGFSKRRNNTQQWDDGSSNPPVIASAKLAPGLPLVPVRFIATINLGTMVVHLVHAELRENGATRTIAELTR